MTKYYQSARLGLVLAFLLALAGLQAAQAQTLVYGNEWIVPGQQYYKLKLARTGLYKIDYQYLTAAGITGVAPENLQLWRRGRELTRYVGGNAQVLDPTTYIEFFGQRNDGLLDRDFYKSPADQPQPTYSYTTDTASYFITWSIGAAARTGRAMPEPVTAAGTPHPHRLFSVLTLQTYDYGSGEYSENQTFQPWFDKGEGYLSGYIGMRNAADGVNYNNAAAWPTDSVLSNVPLTSISNRLEVSVVGSSRTTHRTEIAVIQPNNTVRVLDTLFYSNYDSQKGAYILPRTDIDATGKVRVRFRVVGPSLTALPYDRFRVANYRVTVQQANRWYANKRHVIFRNDSLLAGPATYEVDSIPAVVHGYDITDPYNVQRITSVAGSRTLSRVFVFPNATAQQTRRLMLAGERPYTPLPAQRVTFRTLNVTNPNYVIITSNVLLRAAGSIPNAAQAYADYRSSAAGGGYSTLVVTSEELYDQFHYGEKSALALRRFVKLVTDNAAGQKKNLLLLGNGVFLAGTITPINAGNREVLIYRKTPPARTYSRDLVPMSGGRSTSDTFYSADWQNGSYVPKMITGRIPATTPQEVINYLDKIRTHEALGMEPWRKNTLNLLAGTTAAEFTEFSGYISKVKQRVERPLWGGTVVNTYGRTSQLPVSVKIDRELNAGLSLINYFGHGSNNVLGLDFGTPDVATNNYNNTGRYPVMIINGCASAFTSGGLDSYDTSIRSFAELWMLAPNKGSIGLLGQSGLGYAQPLATANDTVLSLLLNNPNWYGKPVPEVYAEAVRRLTPVLSNQVSPSVAADQLMSTMWLGDPALRLYAPDKPDYQTSSASLSLTSTDGRSITAASGTFALNIAVQNPGKITHDTLQIRVRRELDPNSGGGVRDTIFKFHQSWCRDTVYTAVLHNLAGMNVFGNNTFQVDIDPLNLIPELNENNNSGRISFAFLKAGVTALSPREFAIVGNNRPHLVAQNNNPGGSQRAYSFEIDTTAAFNSPLSLRQTATITAGLTPDWQPARPLVAGRDSAVWYWRVRFQTPAGDEDTAWTVSSFRIIQGNGGGWSQSHYTQLQRDQRENLSLTGPTGRWRFVDERKALKLRTRGGGPTPQPAYTFPTVTGAGIAEEGAALPYVGNCATQSPNLLLVVYDQHTLRKKLLGQATALTCGSPQPNGTPQLYMFATNPTSITDTLNNINNSPARQADLQALLNLVPDGDYVALISTNRVRWAAPALAPVKATLSSMLGSTLVNQLQNGDPLALLARKSSTGGRILHELGPDPSSATPRANQIIELNDTLSTPSTRGKITSTRIGPAQDWQTLHHWIVKESTTSSYQLRVIGIDTLGNSTVLQSNVPSSRYALTGNISARQYPYLQLELEMQDSTNRMAPQLREWFITYRGVPEGVVRRDLVAAADYDPARLATMAADSGYVRFPVKFENVTSLDFGTPLKAKVDVRDASGNGKTVLVTAPRQLKGDSTITFQVKVPMIGLFGTFNTRVTVNPQPQALPELYYFNNDLTLDAFTVIDRNLPPTLDVAFDGRRIMNGELVSPRPLITIQMNDEDRLRHITDVSFFTVTLQRAGQPAVPVDLRSSAVRFSTDITKGSVAKLEYQPGLGAPLADGMYTLRVQGRDPSNAAAGTSGSGDAQDYEVKFEVVNASTITNVFPYPNPVTSKAKFVFTVTGEELPRNMKIQIMTIAGRVVREIFMSELGPLHIGNNITEYAWDGTDEYGDRLANGTYLYRVSLDDPQSQFGQRRTAADKAFKNDWGKLVLMR